MVLQVHERMKAPRRPSASLSVVDAGGVCTCAVSHTVRRFLPYIWYGASRLTTENVLGQM